MINYYTYEKLKKDEIKNNEKSKIEQKQIEKHKSKKNEQMIKSYYDRLTNFIFQQASNPTPLNDYKSPINSTRQQLLQEENDKIRGDKKGMVFRKYVSEKERIDEYLKEKQKDKEYEEYITKNLSINKLDDDFLLKYKKFSEKVDKESRENKHGFMRYKPKNDLERLFDTINKNKHGSISKEAINDLIFERIKNEHIKKLLAGKDNDIDWDDVEFEKNVTRLENIKDKKEKLDWIKKYHESKEKENEEKENNNTLKSQHSFRKKRVYLDKTEARLYLNEYNKKYHFKSASKFPLLYDTKLKTFNYDNKEFIEHTKARKKFRRYINCPFQYIDFNKENKNLKKRIVKSDSQYSLKNINSRISINSNQSEENKSPNSSLLIVSERSLNKKGKFEFKTSLHNMNNINNSNSSRKLRKRNAIHEETMYKNYDIEDIKNTLDNNLSSIIKKIENVSKKDYITPKEISKINFNPYKKRENYEEYDFKLKTLHDLAFTTQDIKSNDKLSKIKNAKYISSLKRKTQFKNVQSGEESKQSSYANLVSGILSKTNVITNKIENNNKLKFEVYDIESAMINNPLTFFEEMSKKKNIKKKNTDEKIYIDNKEFLRTNIGDITKKVLEKCNFSSLKNKNNLNTLKIGQGKMMMTKGMSITEFSKTFRINP